MKDNIVKFVKIIRTDCIYVFFTIQFDKTLFEMTQNVLFGVRYVPHEGTKYASYDCFLEIEQVLIH